MTEFRNSNLVQRLEQPHTYKIAGKEFDDPFAFGGGRKNGGLSDEAMNLIRGIFSFDYMGSSEFEWGAVPTAMSKIAQSNLTAFTFEITLADVTPNWRDRSDQTPEGNATIYVLCPTEITSEIEQQIRDFATKEKDLHLQEPTRLAAALRPDKDWDSRTVGWLELDNGFMFFTDKEMWEKTCKLFGVETEVTA